LIQERHQYQAADGSAQQVEEIDPIHALDGLRHSGGNDGSGKEKWQRGREVNQRERRGRRFARHAQQDDQRDQHHDAVQNRQSAQFRINVAPRNRDNVGEHAAGAQPE
jgi:hypothetical protein